MNVQTATPAEIDSAWAEVNGRIAQVASRRGTVCGDLRRYAGFKADRRTGIWTGTVEEALDIIAAGRARTWDQSAADRLVAVLNQIDDQLAELHAEAAPFRAEWDRRGGWTRFFLVNNADGHVHSSMDCSTCNNGIYATQFKWITEFSGQDEAGIVELAGEKACTTCYPSAPAVGKADPRFRSDDEVRSAEFQAEKAAKLDARRAKAIFPEDPRRALELRTDQGRLEAEPKTVRAVELQYSDKATRAYVATERARRHTNVLARTHDAEEAARLADRATYWTAEAAENTRLAEECLAALAIRHGVSVEDQRAVYAAKLAKKQAAEYI